METNVENLYPITDINIWQPKLSRKPPAGWSPIMKTISQRYEADLNSGSYKTAGPIRITQKLILLVKREKGKQPLTDIAVMFADNSRDGLPGETPPKTHARLAKNVHGTTCNINMSTLGRSIRLLYSRTLGVPILDLQVIFADKGEKEAPGYICVDRTISGTWEADLNAGGEYGGEHGRHVFLSFRYCPQTSVFVDLFRLNRKGFDLMQWVEVKTPFVADTWQQRLMVVKGGEVMMFEGPFAKKLKILSEDYYYDMEWLKSQDECIFIEGGKVEVIDDCIFVSSDPLPSFTFKPVEKENFDSFVNCLKAIVEKKDFDPLILEEDEGDMDDENQDGASSLPPITNISLQHEKCTKIPPGWKLVQQSVSGQSGCIAYGRVRHCMLVVERDPTLPPLRNVKVLFHDRDEYGNIGENCPTAYKRIRKCVCKQHPGDLNPNKGARSIARNVYMAVSYVGGANDTPLTEIAVVQEGEEVPEGWEVITKTSSGRWDANLGTGGSEKRVVYLAVKREPLPTTKEEEIVPEEEKQDLTFSEKMEIYRKNFWEFTENHSKFRAYFRGGVGLLVVSAFCFFSVWVTVLFIIIASFLESQKTVRNKRQTLMKEYKKFKKFGPSLYEPPQLSTYPGLFAAPLEVKEEESQTEEERLIEREKVERAKEAERRRLEDEKGSDGDWELMRSSSSIALLNPKAEKCEWLNDILYKFWRTSAQGLMSQSLGMTRDIIDMVMVTMQELPLMRGVSIILKEIQVGDKAPYLKSMSAVQMVGCDEIVLDTELKWNSNISIRGTMKKLGIPVPFTISDLSLNASAKVGIKINRDDIFKSLLGITLTQECSPDFKVAAGSKIPGFDQIIHIIVKAVISMLLLWPTYMAFQLDGSPADFFEETEEQKKLPFAELVLLRGDTHRGKLPLGWNMVKALHAPWITPIKGANDFAYYLCYRRATPEDMTKDDFEPITSLRFVDGYERGNNHTVLSNTLFGLSGNLTGKSTENLYLAIDSDSLARPIVEIAIAQGGVKPKDNTWVPVTHIAQPMSPTPEPFRTQQKTSLYVRYGEKMEIGKGKGKEE